MPVANKGYLKSKQKNNNSSDISISITYDIKWNEINNKNTSSDILN